MLKLVSHAVRCEWVRGAKKLRGRPPQEAKSIARVLHERKMAKYDPEVERCVNIGFPMLAENADRKNAKERAAFLKDRNRLLQLEKQTRHKTLQVSIDEIRNECSLTDHGLRMIKTIGDYYGIYRSLFGYAFFYPKLLMDIEYCTEHEHEPGTEWCTPVRFGNFVKPTEAKTRPNVRFDDNENRLWTLMLLNLDGDVSGECHEHIHWFIANICGNKLETGDELVEYLQPVPAKGTGYHRHVFVLFEQRTKLDYADVFGPKDGTRPEHGLDSRKFSMLSFYRERQRDLTAASFAFFQSNWDQSVQAVYQNVFDEPEPIYEYDFPKPFVNPNQKHYPNKSSFNLYLDKFRDPKTINKEFLVKHLRDVNPFRGREPDFPFPNAEYLPKSMPSWLKTETRKARMRIGRIRHMLDEKNI